jgi:hypothetical protein
VCVCVCVSVPHFVSPLVQNCAMYSNIFCYNLHSFQNLRITLFYRKQQIIIRHNYILLEQHYMFRIIRSITRWSKKCCAFQINCSSVDRSFVAFFISGTKRDELLKSKKALFHFWSDNWSTLTFLRNKNAMADRINKLWFQVPQAVCGRNAVSVTSSFNNVPYAVWIIL